MLRPRPLMDVSDYCSWTCSVQRDTKSQVRILVESSTITSLSCGDLQDMRQILVLIKAVSYDYGCSMLLLPNSKPCTQETSDVMYVKHDSTIISTLCFLESQMLRMLTV